MTNIKITIKTNTTKRAVKRTILFAPDDVSLDAINDYVKALCVDVGGVLEYYKVEL